MMYCGIPLINRPTNSINTHIKLKPRICNQSMLILYSVARIKAKLVSIINNALFPVTALPRFRGLTLDP